MNKKSTTRELSFYAILIALTTVFTMFINIPSPATKGYVNIGDIIVIFSAILAGRRGGFLIGGLGSALADLILGYTHYIPITFIVKGLEGYIMGYLTEKKIFSENKLIPAIIAGVWMSIGYYLFEIFLYGAKAALASLPGNLVQGIVGAVGAIALYKSISKIDYFKDKFNL